MARYRVFIERTETYSYQVVVNARDEEEAERKVQLRDDDDKFSDVWNELQPEVQTTYEAEEA